MLVIWLLVLLLGVAYLAHSRTAALPALGITATYLVAMALFSPVPGWLQLLLWIVTGAIAAFILLGDLPTTVHQPAVRLVPTRTAADVGHRA